jgi:hypothetical protein
MYFIINKYFIDFIIIFANYFTNLITINLIMKINSNLLLFFLIN